MTLAVDIERGCNKIILFIKEVFFDKTQPLVSCSEELVDHGVLLVWTNLS